jgi:hypothetical protein
MKKLIFFLFISVQVFSQQLIFKGKLVDKETNKPVVYANISFLNSEKGISSQENGEFEIPIDKKLLESKIHISCLNYKDTIVFAKDLQNKTLYLKAKDIELKEIVLSKKRNKKIILDEVKKRVSPLHTAGIRMIAKYFPNELTEDFLIEKVEIHFSKRNATNAKFRIRIFSKDLESNFPKEDLLIESIPISIQKGQRLIEINLEDYYLSFPKDGVFVVFEKLLIPYNFYEWKESDEKFNKYYAPIIGITKSKEFKDYKRVSIYSKGKWVEAPMDNGKDNYVPAISLTLSN